MTTVELSQEGVSPKGNEVNPSESGSFDLATEQLPVNAQGRDNILVPNLVNVPKIDVSSKNDGNISTEVDNYHQPNVSIETSEAKKSPSKRAISEDENESAEDEDENRLAKCCRTEPDLVFHEAHDDITDQDRAMLAIIASADIRVGVNLPNNHEEEDDLSYEVYPEDEIANVNTLIPSVIQNYNDDCWVINPISGQPKNTELN